jgi:hypothetical protein
MLGMYFPSKTLRLCNAANLKYTLCSEVTPRCSAKLGGRYVESYAMHVLMSTLLTRSIKQGDIGFSLLGRGFQYHSDHRSGGTILSALFMLSILKPVIPTRRLLRDFITLGSISIRPDQGISLSSFKGLLTPTRDAGANPTRFIVTIAGYESTHTAAAQSRLDGGTAAFFLSSLHAAFSRVPRWFWHWRLNCY